MVPIGFGTGCVHKLEVPQNSKESIAFFRSLGCTAIEINCHTHKSIDDLKNISPDSLYGFEYVSIHAPSSRVTYGENGETKHIISELETFVENNPISYVCFHPDIFTDLATLIDIKSIPIAVENMDHLKASAQDPEEFSWILNTPISIVLDVLHCYDIDKSMSTARRFIEKYHDKIVEIHISGTDTSDIPTHEPLYKTQVDSIVIPEMGELGVPIIIESVIEDRSELEKELNYVMKLCKF